jgi:hypothetical protein
MPSNFDHYFQVADSEIGCSDGELTSYISLAGDRSVVPALNTCSARYWIAMGYFKDIALHLL